MIHLVSALSLALNLGIPQDPVPQQPEKAKQETVFVFALDGFG